MRPLLVLLAACGADPSGTWMVDRANFDANACGLDGDLLPAGELDVGLGGDELELNFNDGSGDIECAWSGPDFECAEIPLRFETQQQAQLTTYATHTGEFRGKKLTARRYGAMQCEGSYCAELEDLTGLVFPCAYDIGFTASR